MNVLSRLFKIVEEPFFRNNTEESFISEEGFKVYTIGSQLGVAYVPGNYWTYIDQKASVYKPPCWHILALGTEAEQYFQSDPVMAIYHSGFVSVNRVSTLALRMSGSCPLSKVLSIAQMLNQVIDHIILICENA
jgi:hypothetical protein